MLVDELARDAQTQVKRDECRSLVGRTVIENSTVELAKPQTFMNLSGEAVSCLIKKDGRGIEGLIVISDDLALPLGSIRLRPKGTHGGHNGLRSIIDCLGTNEFIRLRIGNNKLKIPRRIFFTSASGRLRKSYQSTSPEQICKSHISESPIIIWLDKPVIGKMTGEPRIKIRSKEKVCGVCN